MESRLEAVIGEWQSHPCDPGYAGLHQLADEEFSGVVIADTTRAFMVNGRVIGIHGGSIESFWSSELTARTADDPALPLLCVMLVSDHVVQAEYYTGETTIAEVGETLSQGNFTGYIELSENVFSGDYYAVFYGGTSFYVAFVGVEEQVITGDEAFKRANDEVGIFEVKDVDIHVIDIPDPEVDDSIRSQSTELNEENVATETASVSSEQQPNGELNVASNETDNSHQEQVTSSASEVDELAASAPPVKADSAAEMDDDDVATLAKAAMAAGPDAVTPMEGANSGVSRGSADELVIMPALDPARTTRSIEFEQPRDQQATTESHHHQESTSQPNSKSIETERSEDGQRLDQSAGQPERVAELQEQNDELEQETERLQDRINDLEATIERLETELAEATAESTTSDLSPAAAVAGTNLFVRYRSKAGSTLSDVQSGSVDPQTVRDNLDLEWHTDFDAADRVIEDDAFPTFLKQTTEYQFSKWLVSELMFELQETGGVEGMPELFSAISNIDRVEFAGEIPIHSAEDGSRESRVHAFDIVFRDSMGNPLLVADIHTSREPVEKDAVADLIERANDVATARQSMVGAAFVTTSFYNPDALETVTSTTGGGLLRSGSKKSYVRLSRKRGFHLCLIEGRDESFHLTVPEL